MSSAYCRSLSAEDQRRYVKKLTYTGSKCLPDPLDDKREQLFLQEIAILPKVTWPHLYDYIVESPGMYTRE